MPINRTTPSNDTSKERSELDDSQNVSTRRKQTTSVTQDRNNSILEEIKKISHSLAKQDEKLISLQESVRVMTEHHQQLRDSIDFVMKKYDEMKNKTDKYEIELKNSNKYIKTLEDRIDSIERISRLSSVELRNIPQSQKETKEDLIKIIKCVGSITKIPIQNTEIKDIFRINTKSSKTKPVIVEFTSTMIRENFIKSSKKFITDNKGGLNTMVVNLSGPSVPIYISEALTAKAKRLFSISRNFSKEHNFKYCWTNNGIVYLRKKEGDGAVRIFTEEDLHKLKCSD